MNEQHGTPTGYKRHKRRKEDACDDCLAAWAAYYRNYRATHPVDRKIAQRNAKVRRIATARLINLHPREYALVRHQVLREVLAGEHA